MPSVDGRVVGLVPARGGSKGIARKNLAPLAGRPLLEYTAEAALASKRLDEVVLSTEDEEIAALGRRLGLKVPFLRPASLAQDATPMIEVMRHARDHLMETGKLAAIVLLQPTSPLRRADHIDAAVDLFFETEAATVVSVIRVPHQFSPESLLRMDEGGQLHDVVLGPHVTRRQEKRELYARNGPAVLVVRPGTLDESLYGDPTVALEMSHAESLDVDDHDDLAIAECLLGRNTA